MTASSTRAPWPTRPRSCGSTNGSMAGTLLRGAGRVTRSGTRSISSPNWRTPQLVIHSEQRFPHSLHPGPRRLHRAAAARHSLAAAGVPGREPLGAEAKQLDPIQNRYREEHRWLDQWLRQPPGQAPASTELRPSPQRRLGSRPETCRAGIQVERPPMTELPKTFDPAEIEARWYAQWEAQRPVPPRRPGRGAVDDRQPAAQRHGLAAYRPCARQYAAGRADPPRAAAGQGCAVGGRHRPCRHRDADGGRAPARRAARRSAPISRREEFVAKVWEWKAESGGEITQPAAPARLLDGLGERALHDGRGLFERRPQGVRRPLQPGPALPRQAPGELGPRPRDRDQRPRGRDQEIKGKFWHLRYPLADGSGFIEVATTRPETMLADMAVAVHPRTSATRRWSEARCGCRSPAG